MYCSRIHDRSTSVNVNPPDSLWIFSRAFYSRYSQALLSDLNFDPGVRCGGAAVGCRKFPAAVDHGPPDPRTHQLVGSACRLCDPCMGRLRICAGRRGQMLRPRPVGQILRSGPAGTIWPRASSQMSVECNFPLPTTSGGGRRVRRQQQAAPRFQVRAGSGGAWAARVTTS
jgi:hypothetical protein